VRSRVKGKGQRQKGKGKRGKGKGEKPEHVASGDVLGRLGIRE
jgi:hypothetical protein